MTINPRKHFKNGKRLAYRGTGEEKRWSNENRKKVVVRIEEAKTIK
jgi:hypothetical protein